MGILRTDLECSTHAEAQFIDNATNFMFRAKRNLIWLYRYWFRFLVTFKELLLQQLLGLLAKQANLYTLKVQLLLSSISYCVSCFSFRFMCFLLSLYNNGVTCMSTMISLLQLLPFCCSEMVRFSSWKALLRVINSEKDHVNARSRSGID